MKNNSLKNLLFTCSFTVLLFIGQPLLAKDECFCYKHMESEALMAGCEEFKPPDSSQAEIHCYDDDEGKYTIFIPSSGWVRLNADHPDCEPCEPSARKNGKGSGGAIRGGR